MATIDEKIDIDILAQGVNIAKAAQTLQGDIQGVLDDSSGTNGSKAMKKQGTSLSKDINAAELNLLRALTIASPLGRAHTMGTSSAGTKTEGTVTHRVKFMSKAPGEYLRDDPFVSENGVKSMQMHKGASKLTGGSQQRTQVLAGLKTDNDKSLSKGNNTSYKKASRKYGMHQKVYGLMLIGVVISLALLKPPKSGNWNDFGPRKTMLTGDEANCVFLAISRLTAYAMYPCLIIVFISKCHFARTHLFGTQVSLYIGLERGHHLHVFVGWCVFVLTWLHCVFHVIRWIRNEEMHYIYEEQTGVTGLIAWIASCLIVLPMGMRTLRRNIAWEIRKYAHTILAITFGISIALHAPATNVAWVCGTMVAVYGVDWLWVQYMKTFLVKSSNFHRLDNGVVMYFENPPGFNAPEGGYYLNLCVPFISRFQWHALTVYPHPDINNASCVCIINNGDWSKAIHADTEWHTVRPIWVQGPFLSPYAAVLNCDNAICVASGSGITAALGALHALGSNRRINLIWICREPSMVEFYLNTMDFDNNAFSFIFYTGKRQLMIARELPETTLVWTQRPDIRGLISMIVQMIESEGFLPEELLAQCDRRRERMNQIASDLQVLNSESDTLLETFKKLLGRALQRYSASELLAKLNEKESDLKTEEDMDQMLKDVFNVEMSEEGIKELLDEFAEDVIDEQGLLSPGGLSKKKLIAFCKRTIEEYTHEREDASEASMQAGMMVQKLSTNKRGTQDLRDYLDNMTTEVAGKRLGRWSVCYCGGSAPVNKELKRVCKDFGIQYHQEGFEW